MPHSYFHVNIKLLLTAAFLLLVSPTLCFVPCCCNGNRQQIQLHSTSSPSPSDRSDATSVINYVKSTPVDQLLPSQDLLLIIEELIQSRSLIDDSEALVMKNWGSIERKLRDESRSIKELIGDETAARLLKSIGNIDGYDPAAVKAFLSSDAVNNLLTRVLYDGIFEFFDTVDVFGRIISNLPIIGPIRNQIRDETKKNLDRTLGPLVKSFLGTYGKVATGQATDFALSPANRKMFGQANQRLVSSVLERPLNTLLPPSEMSSQLIDDSFQYIRSVQVQDLKEYVDFVYNYIGSKSIDRAIDVDRVLKSSPTLQSTINNIWAKAAAAASSSSGSDPE